MTTIYFVRHAESDLSIYDDLTRPLTEEGLQASKSVTKFLLDQEIDHVFSSPFKRAIDTVKDFADQSQLSVEVIDDFRERKVSDEWIEDFNCFAKGNGKILIINFQMGIVCMMSKCEMSMH